MLKAMIEDNRRASAAALLALFLLSALLTFEIFQISANVPVPSKKPALTMARPKYGNFMDFSQALPFFTKSTINRQKPVAAGDVFTYREIFELQADGKMAEADRLIHSLQDRRLMGHILYQRYTHPAYKTGFNELKVWLDQYAAEPGAKRIYKMASNRVPAGYKGTLKKPVDAARMASAPDTQVLVGKTYQSPRRRSDADRANMKRTKDGIIAMVMDQRITAALEKLKSEGALFDTVEYDNLRARIAAAYMYQGKLTEAHDIALATTHRSGTYAPLAGWVAGMTAWKAGHYGEAAKFFEVTGRSPYSSGWMAAAGSYWAARAHIKSGDRNQARTWLTKASQHPRTFYGLIATRALGHDFDFNWHVPTFTRAYYDSLMATPEGARAIALVAAGQPHRAESELMQAGGRDRDLRDAILAYAGYAELPALAMRLGNAASAGMDGKVYDSALYPRTSWEPEAGYRVDPALINAIARQESRFDPAAESSRGALGLMQLMPATASWMSKDMKIPAREKEYALKDPETNLEIGQRYIQMLLEDRNVKGDMLKMLVAYNAGPGNLSRWKKQWDDVEDPLLFIELIPSAETRTYVERVLSNYWIYRLREDLPTTTLEALAAGKPALYAADFDRSGNFRLASR